MADWNEHVLNVRARLDKASKQEMLDSVRYVFTEGANIDFNNKENLKSLHALADVMRQIFTTAGNTKIDFTEMMKLPGPELFDGLKEAAREFESVWASVVEKMGSYSLKQIFMKDQQDLNAALNRINSKGGKQIEKSIERALTKDIKTKDINKLLNEAIGVETEFNTAESWEERSAAALRYMKVRDRILDVKNSSDFDPMDIERQFIPLFKNITNAEHRLGSYLVRDLKDAIPQIQTSLYNIFRLRNGESLLGFTEDGQIDIKFNAIPINPLDVGAIFGQKGKNVIEVPIEFQTKLDLMRDLFAEGDFDQLEKLQDEMASMFPEELRDKVLERLEKFIDPESLKKVTDRSYQAIWKDFVGYGMPIGGTGGGFETVVTPEDATSAERIADAAEREQRALGSINKNRLPVVDKYEQASEEVKKLTDKLIALDNQMQTLDERTSAVGMDGFDQWNPTDDQKAHIVQTLGEYQDIMKQIADFPIVQTEDDKKRLIELKEEALKLANTLKLAYRSDSNPDSYMKEYGISRDQARVFMDIQNESSTLRTEIRDELNGAFGETFIQIQRADQEFAKMLIDNADSLGQLAGRGGLNAEIHDETIDDQLKDTIALLEKEKLTYEDVLALVKEYNNESKMKDLAKAGNWDEYDKIFAHHADIARKLVPDNMLGMGSDSPDKWLATVGVSAEDAAKRLKELYDRLHSISTIDDELDIVLDDEDIRRENGALEDKLELLRDIAEQYGSNITQKQRDRYEELNQKDMGVGLTSKEDERYWELSEQIEEADNALEEFGQTYDKIILKLANGKRVEILPDDKGLRSLYKFNDEYGETYGGIEIEDVVFERIQKEAVVADQVVNSLNNSIEETKKVAQSSELGSDISIGDKIGQADGATAEEVENLEKVRSKVAEIATAVEAKTTAFQNEKTTVGTVVDEEVKKLGELEEKVKSITTTIQWLLNNIKNGESNLGEALNNVVVNVNYQKTEGDEQNKTGVEGLKTMLESITYKVKLPKSDTDKNANKIAIDESVLESTLKRVFVNILGAKEPKEQTRENYALDSTLKVVNGTLETISGYTNSISSRFSQNTGGTNKEFNGKILSIESVLKAIRDRMPRGAKTPSVTNQQTNSKTQSTAFSIDKKETQKLALKKFRTELETTGRLTDDLKKKIRGLAISLGMVKNKEGFARWNEKFKQQKLSVGIDDLNAKEDRVYDIQVEAEAIKELTGLYEELGRAQALGDKNESSRLRGEIGSKRAGLTSVDYATDMKFKHAKDKGFNAASTKAENSALAEQAVTVKKLNTLYQQYGVLVERAAFAEGYLKQELESEIRDKNAEIAAVQQTLDFVTPEMFGEFDASFDRGKKMESEKQYAAFAKQMDADEETRLRNIAKLEKEIAILRADADSATNDGVRNALNEEIRLREELIELQKQDLAMDAQDETYYKKKLANDTKLAKSNAAQSAKERRNLLNENAKAEEKKFKEEIKNAQRLAGVNMAESVYKAANDTKLRAIGSSGVSEDIQQKAKELSDQMKSLRILREQISKKGADASDDDIKELTKQIDAVKKLKTEVDGYLKIHEKYSGDNARQLDIDTSGFGTVGSDQYWNNMTAAIKNASTSRVVIKGMNSDTGELTGTTRIAAHTFEEWSATVDPVTGKLSMLRTGIKKTETFIESVTRKTKEIFSYFSGSSIIFKAVNELKKGVQYVRDIDLALTELKKVTDETEETYDKFLQTAAKTGARLGSTISAVTEATATFAKLGYSMQQASEMAEAAIVYKNVGDNIASTEDAADSIISTMKGFKLEATESMAIVDRFNEVGNRFAITSQGIGEALRLSASALSEGGNSLDESIGLITAANEVVNDPSSVGTALKTLTLRLRGSKTELEEMGEDVSDMATTTSQLQAKLLALTGGQVDIMLDENTFKNSTQILREMAEAWEDMTDIQRASALELMGGKRQANVLSALIQNFDTVEDVIETSANSAGSALKENERYLDSIQGKIDQFNNAMQTMWSDTLDSDVVKGFVELATQLVKIVDAIGPLNIALVGFFTYLEKKHGILSNFFKPAEDGVEALKKQLAKAEQDLAKATQADMQHGSKKTAQNRRDAEERVAILKSKIQESSSEAILDGIDESFDPGKVKKSIGGKKGAITKRAKKLESEGMSFAQIEEDPKIKQWTQEVKEGEQALNEYNAKVAQADATLKQKNVTTAQAAGAERAKAGAEAADAAATNAGANADVLAKMASDGKVASTWADVWATLISKDATLADVGAKVKQLLITKLLNMEYVKQKIANGELTVAQLTNFTATQLLGLGFKGLAAGIKQATLKMWEFMTTTPIGWILLAVAAVVALGAAFAAIHKTTEELQEDLDGLKSELSDIESQLDSVNQELETTNKRMAELLAKDSLTFAEQEELDRLRETNDELERRKELLESEKENKEGLVGRQAARVVNSAKEDNKYWLEDLAMSGGGVAGWLLSDALGADNGGRVGEDIEDYRKLKEKYNNASSLKEQEKYQKKLDKKSAEIDEYIATLSEALDGVEYGDSAESDEALDYLAELQDNYGIARGSAGAKTNAIKGIFNKDEFSNTKIAIDQYVKALKDGDQSAAESIAQIIKNNGKLVKDLEARGLDAQDAIDYFTKLGDTARFDTIEGKTKEIERAKASMNDLMSGFKSGSINTNDLFDEDGKIIQTKLSEMFKGTSEKTRAELTKLLEGSYRQIADGLGDDEMESLISRFGLKMELALLDVQNSVLAEQNLELFPNLKDEIDGIIDSFDEMSKALHGVVDAMDLLKQARAEEAYSGSVSLETMEKLMEHTDDYSKIMEVDEYGAIKLVDNAEEILIGTRIEKIKTDAQAALAVAEKTKQEAIAAEQDALNAKQTLELSGPAQQWYIGIMGQLAGIIAYVSSLVESVTKGDWSGMFDRASAAYESAKQSYVWDKTEGEYQRQLAEANAAYDSAVSNRENAEKELKNKELWAQYANGITPENIGSRVNADDASGGNKTKEEVADDLFQKEMAYWENRIAANQSKYEQIQNEIDLLEAKGQKADVSFYEEQIKLENERQWLLEQQKAEAQAFLGTLEEGSEKWWEVANTLNDIEGELDDVTASIVDLQDAIGEIDAYKFEEFNTRISNLTDQLETVRNLLADEDEWFSSEGEWTEDGIAALATYIQELEIYKNAISDTGELTKELNKYQAAYAGNEAYYETLGIHSEQEYYDKFTEIQGQYSEYLEMIDDTEDAIVDMYESSIDAVEEYADTLIDGYNDYIDSVKEALQAERDLYDFKKNVQKQAKDIAEIERRIASLSGSTNKADIAERRKLEAQLYESRESLDDTYRDHAKDSQQDALDAEATAYEQAMTKMVEGMRTSLQEATADMGAFLDSVTIAVSMNADTVLQKYQDTEVPLNDAITNPWEEAAKAVGKYGGDANNLMDVWKKDGYFAEFKSTASTNLSYPWSAGVTAANTFKNSVSTVMGDIANNIRSNVSNITSYLGSVQSAYSGIITSAQRAKAEVEAANASAAAGVGYTGSAGTPQPTYTPPAQVDNRILSKYKLTASQVSALGYGPISLEEFERLLRTYQIKYSAIYKQVANTQPIERSLQKVIAGEYVTGPMAVRQYAKGTTGTPRDEWAITDEAQFGDELVLVPGKDGNLSFMRKGTGVVPADITQKLFELAQIPTSDLMNKNLTAIVPNITKNDFKNEFNFESLVHVDTVDSDTLPKLEKMVDKKIDDFSKALNYSLKRFAR